MLKVITIGACLIISLFTLSAIGQFSIQNNAIPSLAEFIASSTPQNTASTTVEYNSATTTINFYEELEPDLPIISLKTPKGELRTFVASTANDQERGLGKYTSLKASSSMLFIFDTVEVRGFWMKDMLFPIDILWLDENKKIIAIEMNVLPGTYPKVFLSPQPIKYVLELNANMAEKFGLKTAQYISF